MNDNTKTIVRYDWDDVITNDGLGNIGNKTGHLVLEPGDYSFTVEGYEKSIFHGRPESRIPDGVNQATVFLKIDTAEGERLMPDRFYLCSLNEWKLAQFFCSVGLKKKGEPCRIDFDSAVGRKGVLRLEKTRGSNGISTINNIVRYYDKDYTNGTKESAEIPSEQDLSRIFQ